MDEMKMRFLIVDDDSDIRQMLSTALAPHGLTVDVAGDGARALDLLRQNNYAVVLLDLLMPNTDGLTALRVIKRISPATQVVILTSHQGDDQLFEAIKAGAISYVLKAAGVERGWP